MPGSSNFLQWNPTQANQESDGAYLADSQRVGGAPNGTPFPSQTGNKLFYQLSTFVAAFGQMMATKGFAVSDANLATLASVLANIITTNDGRAQLAPIAYAPTINFDMSQATGFQVTLAGPLTFTITNMHLGDVLTFVFLQDGTGGRIVTPPGSFYSWPGVDTRANLKSVLKFTWDGTGFLTNSANFQSGDYFGTGLDKTVIGAVFPSTANFVTPSPGDNSQKAATTAFVTAALAALSSGTVFNPGSQISFGSATKGHIKFPSFLGSLIIQWGNVLMPGSGSTDNPTAFTFDVTFPNHILGITVCTHSASTFDRIAYVYNVTNSGGTMSNNGSGANNSYIAVGY